MARVQPAVLWWDVFANGFNVAVALDEQLPPSGGVVLI
jgi:hypothetical protein